jgi:nicotinate phosphoribosyltransferase
MRPIITSILDNDLYKFTMQQAVLEQYPDARVSYKFKNRGAHRFTSEFVVNLRDQIASMADLSLTKGEREFMEMQKIFKPSYLDYLENFRYNPKQVWTELDDEGQLNLGITGTWHSTILWEVTLMALISELYFKMIDTDWDHSVNAYSEKTLAKGFKLEDAGCVWADFGTRRRRSLDTQENVVSTFRNGQFNGFVGTSNVALAREYNLKPIGTMAHEWIMGVSALEGLRYANRNALAKWHEVYQGNLGIALTDTYGSEAFFNDFGMSHSKLYDGVRHDSGKPKPFGERTIEHYKNLNIDPTSKTIVFSDGLNTDKAVDIHKHFEGRIKTPFGIGTHLTSDFENSPALNMVIKLRTVNGIQVVKLSDDPEGKATGDDDAVRVAKWTFLRKELG